MNAVARNVNLSFSLRLMKYSWTQELDDDQHQPEHILSRVLFVSSNDAVVVVSPVSLRSLQH